jgi:hypothetical protein
VHGEHADARALAPGGHLAIHDYLSTSRVGALLSLDMLLNTGGEAHAQGEIRAWLESASLVLVRDERVLPYTHLQLAMRPGGGTS